MARQAEHKGGARIRGRRKLPDFMYGATFPRDQIGSGGPTYGGAVEWLTRHREDVETALRYIQRYPNIVQEPCLDNFWDFVEPLVYNNALLLRYDDFLKTQFGFTDDFELGTRYYKPLPTAAQYFRSEAESRLFDYQYPVRRVVFCCPVNNERYAVPRLNIVEALLPFCCVRTNCAQDQATHVNVLDICRAICGGVFLMFLGAETLSDDVCMHMLHIAIAYSSPIVMVREAGYELPDELPVDEVKLVEVPANAPFMPQRTSLSVSSHDPEQVSNSSGGAPVHEAVAVASALRQGYAQSLVYNPKMVAASVQLLLDRLATILRAHFPGTSAASAVDDARGQAIAPPVRLGSATGSRKPLYRIGSARTTVTFEEAQGFAAQREEMLASSNSNGH